MSITVSGLCILTWPLTVTAKRGDSLTLSPAHCLIHSSFRQTLTVSKVLWARGLGTPLTASVPSWKVPSTLSCRPHPILILLCLQSNLALILFSVHDRAPLFRIWVVPCQETPGLLPGQHGGCLRRWLAGDHCAPSCPNSGRWRTLPGGRCDANREGQRKTAQDLKTQGHLPGLPLGPHHP